MKLGQANSLASKWEKISDSSQFLIPLLVKTNPNLVDGGVLSKAKASLSCSMQCYVVQGTRPTLNNNKQEEELGSPSSSQK